MNSSFEQVKNWLINSKIFVSDSSNENYGAVHSFYDEQKNEFAFLYPEITGYYISSMRFLYEHEKNSKFIEYAKASSFWLLKIHEKYGGVIQGISPQGDVQKFVYSFDTGICVKGLLDCYNLTNDEKLLSYGKQLNQWIIDNTIDENGSVKPLLNLETSEFETDKNVWYKRPGCLHIKLAIPLLELYKITNDELLLNSAKKICNTISDFQNSDGSIVLHKGEKIINLHTLSYALEGLIYAYDVTKDKNYLSCVKNALNWCSKKIEKDGSIDLWFNSKYTSKSSYPIAQIIRLELLAAKIENSKPNDEYLEKLYSFLLSLQSSNNQSNANGGFYEEFYKSIFSWKKRYRVNSWASMFALQALYWYDNFDEMNIEHEIGLLY